ncbi:MAG: hypothetical protein IJV83_00070 [Clostridia bacterium]|nr:hypothetical protein [Clostridia bacterium]
MNKIKVLYLNVQENKRPAVMEIPSDREVFKQLIGQKELGFTSRYISGKRYTIIHDDMGRLRPLAKLSMTDSRLDAPIVGNIIITGAEDKEGDLTSLTNSDIKAIDERKLKWQRQWVITQADVQKKDNYKLSIFLKKPKDAIRVITIDPAELGPNWEAQQ